MGAHRSRLRPTRRAPVHRLFSALVLVTLTFAALIVAAGTANAAAPAGCALPAFPGSTPSKVPDPQIAKGRPVVYVHGWNGTPLSGLAGAVTSRLGGKATQFVFNYSDWSNHWVSDAHIAPCLTLYVQAVSRAYSDAHGDGKVLLVGHSMGGLAIRYSFDPRFVTTPLTEKQVGGVVTVDTPWEGSPFGGTDYARWIENLNHKDVPSGSQPDGGACLAPHSKAQQLPSACGGPVAAYFPSAIPLHTVGGDITVNRKLFGFTLYSLPLASDGIVPIHSSGGYLTGGPTAATPHQHVTSTGVACAVDEDVTAALKRLAGIGGPVAGGIAGLTGVALIEQLDSFTLDDINSDHYNLAAAAQYGVAFLLAPCSHSAMTGNTSAQSDVANAVAAQVAALAPKPAGPPVATDKGYPPFTLGMSAAQATQAAGHGGTSLGSCTAFDVGSGRTAVEALITDPGSTVAVISTPAGTKTDQGVGDGSTILQVQLAYPDRRTAIIDTQAGQSVVVTAVGSDPSHDSGGPGVIGFRVNDDGNTVGPPMIGGIPGFEYCSG